jgi:PAS domain S-box-containing protein
LRPGDAFRFGQDRPKRVPQPPPLPTPAAGTGAPDLRAILESATDYAIIATDSVGRVTEWSLGAEAMFGWTKAEMLGQPIDRALPEDQRAQGPRWRALEEALARGDGHVEGWRLRKSGERFWASARITPLRGPDGAFAGFVKVVRDETEARRLDEERRLMEAELRAAEARLQVAIEAGRMGVWDYDLVEDRLNASAELYRLLGFDGDAAPSFEAVAAGYEPGARERLFAVGREALAAGERRFQAELQYRRPDGEILWLLLRGEIQILPGADPRQVIGVLVDITDRKHAEDSLAAAMRHTDEILESIGDAFYALDGNLRFTYVNGRAAALWRKDAHDLIGRAFADVFPDAIGSAQWNTLEEVRRTREPRRFEAVSPITHTWLDVSVYPATQQGVSVYFRDISERKKAEAQTRLLVNELNHRVKNTLAVVQSIAAQTFREESGEEAEKSFTGRLVALAKAHDVLTREHWEGASVKEIVGRVVSSVSCPTERCRLTGDDVRLPPSLALAVSMAVHELATNAIKYGALSNEAGRVDIEWRVEPNGRGRHLRLEWRERNGPPVTAPTRKGFGTRLLERALAHEEGGRADLVYAPDGVRCIIEASLAWPDGAGQNPAKTAEGATTVPAPDASTAA